jgi:hypothetical protein
MLRFTPKQCFVRGSCVLSLLRRRCALCFAGCLLLFPLLLSFGSRCRSLRLSLLHLFITRSCLCLLGF